MPYSIHIGIFKTFSAYLNIPIGITVSYHATEYGIGFYIVLYTWIRDIVIVNILNRRSWIVISSPISVFGSEKRRFFCNVIFKMFCPACCQSTFFLCEIKYWFSRRECAENINIILSYCCIWSGMLLFRLFTQYKSILAVFKMMYISVIVCEFNLISAVIGRRISVHHVKLIFDISQ